MDQKKIGVFLKELRKEKELTQEQLAEIVQVSNRTVSRWENGNNMPDLDILIELSDFYEVELREILDGERKSENMNKEKEVEAYLKGVLPEEQKLKYEIAQELGILDKVLESGWKSLSAKETGRIGGLLASKRKEEKDM